MAGWSIFILDVSPSPLRLKRNLKLRFFGKLFENTQLVNICSYIGMFASTAATSVGYVYTAEVYPTEIRNVGVGCSSSAAMAGALCAPLMKLLGDVVWWLPPMINGTLGKTVYLIDSIYRL